MKIGLVLEGGGMRGLYTAGVLDVMMEHQFTPDVVCGTSAGVTFGVNLLSQQKGRVLRYNCRYAGDRCYISLHSWLTTGNMINRDFAYDLLPRELDPFDEETFEQSKAAFYATITNTKNISVGRLEKDVARLQALHQLGVSDATRLWDDLAQYLSM